MVFLEYKRHAHRMMILFGLAGIRAAELHGNLSQEERLESLQKFRDGNVDVLLCTDVAARGIDVDGVHAVINYEMPKDITTYVHRVGRTARAGKSGRCVQVRVTGVCRLEWQVRTGKSGRCVLMKVTDACRLE